MSSILPTILGVFGYVLIGFVIKKTNIVSLYIENFFVTLSFNVLLPLALISNFWVITFPDVFVIKLMISFFGSGIIIFCLSFFISKQLTVYSFSFSVKISSNPFFCITISINN